MPGPDFKRSRTIGSKNDPPRLFPRPAADRFHHDCRERRHHRAAACPVVAASEVLAEMGVAMTLVARNILPDMPPLDCPDCDGKLYLQHAPTSWGGNPFAYLCENRPTCRGLCSAHPDGTPQGTPADQKTRTARRLTHSVFDPLWQHAPVMSCYAAEPDDKKATRAIRYRARVRAYAWLADQLGMTEDECHIGLFDIETLRLAYRLCRHASPQAIRDWAKARQP